MNKEPLTLTQIAKLTVIYSSCIILVLNGLLDLNTSAGMILTYGEGDTAKGFYLLLRGLGCIFIALIVITINVFSTSKGRDYQINLNFPVVLNPDKCKIVVEDKDEDE